MSRKNGYNSSAKNYGQYNPDSYSEWPEVTIDFTRSIKKICVKDEAEKFYAIHTIYKNRIFQNGLVYMTLDELRKIFKDKKLSGWVEYYEDEKFKPEEYKIVADHYYEKYTELKTEYDRLKEVRHE